MTKISSKKSSAFLISLLIFITLTVALQNIEMGQRIAGWDNLMTEFNPGLGVKRALYSVWQEYQSLGLLAGMSHSADMLRSISVLFLSLILPQWAIRFTILSISLAIGVIGAFFLAKKRMEAQFAFVTALFYLFSLGTVQIMFIPYEPFSLFFAFLPWQLFSFIRITSVKNVTKKDLVLFAIIHLLASGYAYVQTLFIVYILLLVLMSFVILLKLRTLHIFKTLLLLAMIIFSVNSYWLLPQLYFVTTSRTVVQKAKSNQLSTDTTVLQNQEKGTIEDYLSNTGYYFDLYNSSNQQLFEKWKVHIASHEVLAWVPYLLFSLIGLGIISQLKKNIDLIPLFLLTSIALLGNTPIIDDINQLLRGDSIINQLFRSPFTKFIIPHTLLLGYFLGLGTATVSSYVKRIKFMPNVFVLVISALLIYSSLPSFFGYYFSPNMRGPIPSAYVQVMDYFKGVDSNKRIALLPDYTFWGWFKYRWGYDGSGFLWYGIEQPIISRTFDVWSRESENYYWEIKQAIESEDATLFQNVANKYNVSYFLLDTSLVPVTSSAKGMQYERLEHILPQIPSIKRIKQWDNLVLYENTEQARVAHFMEVVSDMPVMGPHIEQTNRDTAYSDSFGYVTEQDLNENVAIYPFANLTTQTRLSDPDWKLTENSTEFILEYTHTVNPDTHDLIMPFERFQQVLYTDIGVATKSGYMYTLRNKKGNLTVHFPKILLKSFDVTETEVENCGNVSGNLNINKDIDGLFIETNNQANACFGYSDATLDQKYSYLAQLEFEPIQGRSLLFYTLDLTKKESVIEDRLRENQAYFIIPPRYPYGLGYNFSFQQNSYTNIPSTNKLKQLAIYAFPFDELKQIKFVQKNAPEYVYKELVDHTSQKYAYYLYSLQINSSSYPSPYIALYQAYHPGWKAYRVTDIKPLNLHFPFFTGTEIVAHLRVNNWANGWKLPDDFNFEREKIVIVFWPQYLQYVGFILLWITVCILVFPWKHKKHSSH